jgi:hypothetical protein
MDVASSQHSARFTLSQHVRPMIANHELVHFRGHVMLQSGRSSHFEAFMGRMYPYVGHRVENEMFKRDFFMKTS